MIVVGGWPGRQVVGLNGRFGVRPADFSTGGDYPNPLLDDVDAGDETTEFVAVVQTLPSSGVVDFDDLGGFSHTGAADGTYTTTFTLYTWAQGGPLTQHAPDESISTSFGAGFAVSGAGGIASATAFGSPAVSASFAFSVTGAGGIASAAAFGVASANFSQTFAVSGAGGVASANAFGVPSITATGTFTVSGAGVGSTTAFGIPAASFTGFPVVVTPRPYRRTRYTPALPPSDPSQLSSFLRDELERLVDSLESPFNFDFLEKLNAPPSKLPEGKAQIVYADGTNWDPGAGEGVYAYYAGSWKKLG